jgi:hypothetical protein
MQRPLRPTTLLALALAALVGMLIAPALAAAEWREIPAPVTPMYTMTVANQSDWLADGGIGTAQFKVTADGGADWTTVEVPGFTAAYVVGAASDGSFRVIAGHNLNAANQESQVFKISPGGTIEPLGPAIHGPGDLFQDEAVSPVGETWVPHQEAGGAGWVLTRVAADGSSSDIALPEASGTYGWRARTTALGLRLLRFVTAGVGGAAYGGQDYRVEGAQVLAAETYPVSLVEGGWEYSGEFGRGSWDGGASWSEEDLGVVPRTPGLGQPRYLTVRGGMIAERYSSVLYRETGLSWPKGAPTNYVADAGPLIAWGSNTIFVEEGALPPMPLAIGQLQPDAQRLIARADVFRADAGLPPLTGDATVSAASHNHSSYTALNVAQAAQSPHSEQPGLPGFTGQEPWDRCAAVGTSCNSEIMYSPGYPDPVGGWLATIYHRPLIGSPEAGIVGGGEVSGGWSVMDSKGPVTVLVGPFGYPVGRWRGFEGFSGEVPDPVAACREAGQPISFPIGIAVSLYLPTKDGSVSAINVRKHGELASQPGCLLGDQIDDAKQVGVFILDEPLVPGATYDVSAVWNPGEDFLQNGTTRPSANLTYSWSFHFESDGAPGGESSWEVNGDCAGLALKTLRAVTDRHRFKRSVPGIELKLGLSRKAKLALESARLDYRQGHRRRSVKLNLGDLAGRSTAVGQATSLRIRLPRPLAKKVSAAGGARLDLKFAGHGAGCSGTWKFSRGLSVSPGFVRTGGRGEWVTPQGSKKHH